VTSYVPPMPIWHCRSCAIEWTGRPKETCWACGGPAECGTWRSENGRLPADNQPDALHGKSGDGEVVARSWQSKRGLVTGRAKREAVFARDNWHCTDCGRSAGEAYVNSRGRAAVTGLEVDHIIPRSAGGTSDLDNLQTLCSSCNGRKGANV
jgi:hypothetical protein